MWDQCPRECKQAITWNAVSKKLEKAEKVKTGIANSEQNILATVDAEQTNALQSLVIKLVVLNSL